MTHYTLRVHSGVRRCSGACSEREKCSTTSGSGERCVRRDARVRPVPLPTTSPNTHPARPSQRTSKKHSKFRVCHFALFRLSARACAMQPGKRPLPVDPAAAADGAASSPSKARLVQKSLGNFFQRSAASTPFPQSAPAPLQAEVAAKPVAATPAKRALVDDDELDALLAQAPDSFFDAPASVTASSATSAAERAPAAVAQTPPAKVRPILAQQQPASPAVVTPSPAAAFHKSSPARPLISPAASFAVRAASEMSPRGTQSPVKPPPSTPPASGVSRASGSASTPGKSQTPYRSLFGSPADGDAPESPPKPDVRSVCSLH